MKRVFILLFTLPVLAGCVKKAAENNTPLPELGISVQLPPGMEAVSAEDLQQAQDASAEFPPVEPFADFPVREFHDPSINAVLIISKLSFTGPESAGLDAVSVMENYRANLAAYYGVDLIAANELIQGDFKLTIMPMVFEPEGAALSLTKVLYYAYPQRYFVFDLYFNSGTNTISPEKAGEFEKLFLSVKNLE
ncbi:MAG: hypothetical protein LBO80_07685 [Treponema sp.]|nr:hypothetical protein [Treponema sp.]